MLGHVRRNNKVREHVFPGMFGYKDGIAVFPSAPCLNSILSSVPI